MKIVKNILIWLSLAVYLLIVPAFTVEKSKDVICKRVKVTISDSIDNLILNRHKVYKLLTSSDIEIVGTYLHRVNTLVLESELNLLPEIKRADLYKTLDGTVHVKIIQRKPVVRVMGNQIKGFYLDEEGEIIPVNTGFSSHVLVANGNITTNFSRNTIQNIKQFKGEAAREHRALRDLHVLACYINKSEFWNAQVEQVFVNSRKEFELVPRVGSHLILLGDISNLEEKFKNLYALYQVGFDHVNWNDYEKINLKYKNQVVCTKR